MNEVEVKERKRLEREGWEVYHRGSPDFLLVKRNKYGRINKVKFVEVKTKDETTGYVNKLSYEQKIWKHALEFLDVDYELVIVHIVQDLYNCMCIICGKSIEYSGRGRRPRFCKVCAVERNRKKSAIRQARKRSLGSSKLNEFKYDDLFRERDAIERELKRFHLYNIICKECGCTQFEYDAKRSEYICKKCGAVYENAYYTEVNKSKYKYVINKKNTR